jgi:hypothetical protein
VYPTGQGSFAFERPDGNPSNVPLNGRTDYQIGTATWPLASSCPPGSYAGCPGAPTNQTILLHINDSGVCQGLYGGTEDTCFVFPGERPPPPPVCNGNPACKTAIITEADQTRALTVPGKTLLHIHYTYIIVNQPTNSFNMIFNPPTPSTQDINTGGGKDYFGCEQQPDPNGQPSGWPAAPIANYQSTGFTLNFKAGNGGGCPQSRFFLYAPATITLTPGQSVTFTIDMITRVNRGGNQEYTSCGPHLLNSGFTVKWIESDDNLLHSYSTNIDPIYVNVVSGGNLVCSQ